MGARAYAVSEGQKFAGDTTLVVVACFSCGCVYAIPESFDNSARRWHGDTPNGWSIYCPFGHRWHYAGETELARVKRLHLQAQAQAKATKELLEHESRSHAATKGHLTRTKRRVAAGVCPVQGCHRSFSNLSSHIASKHPDYVDEA